MIIIELKNGKYQRGKGSNNAIKYISLYFGIFQQALNKATAQALPAKISTGLFSILSVWSVIDCNYKQ
jgi:hypothetical protein